MRSKVKRALDAVTATIQPVYPIGYWNVVVEVKMAKVDAVGPCIY